MVLLLAVMAAAAAVLVSPQLAAADECMGVGAEEVSPACGGGGGGGTPPPPPPEESPPPPPPPSDDGCGGCGDPEAEGYAEDVGPAQEPTFYDHQGSCKAVYWGRQRKTWWGKIVFRYIEQVAWCWQNGVITYVNRSRWPELYSWLWNFSGHVSSNCSSEGCEELAGAHEVDIRTIGHFEACKGWCFLHSYPGVLIRINGWGGWIAVGWGGENG
jgi:hypothetical protein